MNKEKIIKNFVRYPTGSISFEMSRDIDSVEDSEQFHRELDELVKEMKKEVE